jgi:predicted peptidase
LAKYPDRFAAASVICGAAPLQYAVALSRTPTSIYIGLEDDVVAPVYSQHYFQAIDDGLGTHRLFEYPDVDHRSWDSAFAEPSFLGWMFGQVRE